MLRSSENIAALAAALAKAQSEIENPPKSLTATIESPFPREGRRSFRYAPLSAGLDIIRKCLSQHEIATVQATAIDYDVGLIRLTTTLVHTSGEWIASDWPVCPVSDTAAPHRMGSALTYARRYALFALVGIAGEDDLDAPDLLSGAEPKNYPPAHEFSTAKPDHAAAEAPSHKRQVIQGRTRKAVALAPETSAALRDQMLAGIQGAASAQDLDDWAARAWSGVSSLARLDGDCVRQAFTAKLAGLRPSDASSTEEIRVEPSPAGDGAEALAIPKEQRRRDKQHLRFVAQQPCLVCGRQPCDPHHLRFAQPRGLALKVSDEFTVPLCRVHHRELHRTTREVDWWSRVGVEPLQSAQALWSVSHPAGPPAAGHNRT